MAFVHFVHIRPLFEGSFSGVILYRISGVFIFWESALDCIVVQQLVNTTLPVPIYPASP